MRTGSTAIDAIVSDAPASDSAPKVSAAAQQRDAERQQPQPRAEHERERRPP